MLADVRDGEEGTGRAEVAEEGEASGDGAGDGVDVKLEGVAGGLGPWPLDRAVSSETGRVMRTTPTMQGTKPATCWRLVKGVLTK